MKAPQSSIYGEQFGSLGHANQGGVSQSNIGVGVGGSLSFSVGKYDLLTFSVGFTFTETNTNVNGLRESYESVGGLFTTSFTAGRFFGGSP